MVLQIQPSIQAHPLHEVVRAVLHFSEIITGGIVSVLDDSFIVLLVIAAALIIVLCPLFLPYIDKFPASSPGAAKRLAKAKELRRYLGTWFPIAVFISFGITFVHADFWRNILIEDQWSQTRKDQFTLYYPMVALMAVSLIVIAYVCLIWHYELDELKYEHEGQKHSERDENSFSRHKWWARTLCFVCIAVAIGLSICLASTTGEQYSQGAPETIAKSWDQLTEINETFSFLIFVIFVVIDVCVYRAAQRTTHEGSAKLGKLAWEAVCIVDVPCVIGVAFVMCLHRTLHTWMYQNALFTVGCSAGAIAIHVAITQSAFAVMKTRDILKGLRPNLGGHNASRHHLRTKHHTGSRLAQ